MITIVPHLARLVSPALGALALLRLGALPDDRFTHGAWGKTGWVALTVCLGVGALIPVGPALTLWRCAASSARNSK